jgi:hypothetical protein
MQLCAEIFPRIFVALGASQRTLIAAPDRCPLAFLIDGKYAIATFVKAQQFAKKFARFRRARLERGRVLSRAFMIQVFQIGEVDGGEDQHGALGEIEVKIGLVGDFQNKFSFGRMLGRFAFHLSNPCLQNQLQIRYLRCLLAFGFKMFQRLSQSKKGVAVRLARRRFAVLED